MWRRPQHPGGQEITKLNLSKTIITQKIVLQDLSENGFQTVSTNIFENPGIYMGSEVFTDRNFKGKLSSLILNS